MRRLGLFGFVLLFSGVSFAQQTPVRVRLLSLYRLPQVVVTPLNNANISWDKASASTPLDKPLTLEAQGDVVRLVGRTGSILNLQGEFQITGERTRPQNVRVPVEITAHDGSLQIVALFPMEEYVATVVQGETAGDMPPEALKALAVAVRSYATHFRERHKTENFDFCDTTHCQYLRLDVAPPVAEAVKQTSGVLLWDKGTPLAAYYHKDCGGRTEAAATVWPDQKSQALVSQPDTFCLRASKPWRSDIKRCDLQRAMESAGLHIPKLWNSISIEERTPSGRARLLRIGSGRNQGVQVSASSFRFAVGRALGWNILKSDFYEISGGGEHFVFSGRGVGHGVGLCQTGAAEMARAGKTYREILALYYSNAPIGKSAQGIAWIETPGELFEMRAVNTADLPRVRMSAKSAIEWAQTQSGLQLQTRPTIEVYPSTAMFRDATGEPGWVAASTRGNRVRLQPPNVLGNRLESVLRHEFLHMVVEANAKANTPLWFREGLVIYLDGEPQPAPEVRLTPAQIDGTIQSRRSQREVKQAYAAAAILVRKLAGQYGRARLIDWLRGGIPAEVVNRLSLSRQDEVTE